MSTENETTQTATEEPAAQSILTPETEDATADETPITSVLQQDEPTAEEPESNSATQQASTEDDAQQKAAAEDEAYKNLLEHLANTPELALGKNIFGEEVKFSNNDIKAIYPALQKAGVPSANAEAVVKTFAALKGAQLKLENENYVKHINSKADECERVFGEDIDRVRRFAKQGLNMMDKGLRDELYATPVLLNDHRFLSFLASVGEKFSIDDGGSAGAQGRENDGSFNPAAWVKTSNR